MLALDLLQRFVDQHPYGVSAGFEAQIRYSLGAYCRFCRQEGLAVFDTDLFNQWIDSLRVDRAPDTVRTQRGNLLVLWWWAHREGLIGEAPTRVRRLRPSVTVVTAWTTQEVLQLFSAARKLVGAFPGTRWQQSWWTESLLRAGYDSALRLGDLLRLTVRDLNPCEMPVRQSKTNRVVRIRFRPETYEAILRTVEDHPNRLEIWPLWGRREALYRHVRQLVSQAGVRRGTFRWLRRAAVTALERVAPGRGTELAGHARRDTTERWYLDRSQLTQPPLPPLQKE